jgi:hypothetical protein
MMRYFWIFWAMINSVLLLVGFANDFGGLMTVIVIANFFGALIYMLPVIVADARGVVNVAPCFIVCFFLGWSLIGWVAAWVLALSGETAKDGAKKQAAHIDSITQGIEAALARRGA